MKYSIGEWTDSQFQRQIKCISKKEGFENLQEIYEEMYTDPAGALNKIRQHLENLIKELIRMLLEYNPNLKEKICKEFNQNENASNINDKYKKLYNKKCKEPKNMLDKYKNNPLGGNVIVLNTLTEIPTNNEPLKLPNNKSLKKSDMQKLHNYADLIRIYGNIGSHHNISEDKLYLRQVTTISLMGFFEFYNIVEDDNITCKHFNDFIYDKLAVIYQTKDDLEEWEKIRFNKLQFEYNLYKIEGTLSNDKQLLLDKIINKEKETQLTHSKNIYIVDDKDENLLQRFRKFYKKLSSDVSEEKYFSVNENKDIEYEIIDTIPLRLLPVNEKNPYKWDMCYINLSIELDDFGVDLILLLNFNPEKFNTTIENYELEINTFSSLRSCTA